MEINKSKDTITFEELKHMLENKELEDYSKQDEYSLIFIDFFKYSVYNKYRK